jgi:hypothetical protein
VGVLVDCSAALIAAVDTGKPNPQPRPKIKQIPTASTTLAKIALRLFTRAFSGALARLAASSMSRGDAADMCVSTHTNHTRDRLQC